MTQDSKYYTPSIEEFHVGFEYSCVLPQWETQDWRSTTVGTNENLDSIDELIKLARVRVKYLDKEDIESLGFKFSGKAIDDWYKKETSLRLESGHWVTSFRLQHDRDNSFKTSEDHCYNVKIYAVISGSDDDVLFEGIVKNKSELKVLLKQLGIE